MYKSTFSSILYYFFVLFVIVIIYWGFVVSLDMPSFLTFIDTFWSRSDSMTLLHVYLYSNLRASIYRIWIWFIKSMLKIFKRLYKKYK
jgi:hypothetical protein